MALINLKVLLTVLELQSSKSSVEACVYSHLESNWKVAFVVGYNTKCEFC